MPTFIYTNDIPDANNNPSTDQPDMKVNTNSIDSLINVDHYSFQESGYDGTHRHVQLRDDETLNGTIPTGLQGSGWETIYSSKTSGIGDLWFVREAALTGIRLTGPGTPNPIASAAAGQASNGYTFLPGGMLLQFGLTNAVGASLAVSFPITFSTALLSLTLGTISGAANRFFTITSQSTSGFTVVSSTGISVTGSYWMAIGY